MAQLLLKARLALELPAINRALDELLEEVPAPARPAAVHTVTAGGKRLRPLLTILCAHLFGAGSGDDLRRLAATLEMLHAATLLHDDVIDNADLRRGKPAGHVIFGNTRAILTGDALLSTANAHVATYGKPALCRVFARAAAETTAGEILELDALGNAALAAEEYEAIIRGKTACLIRAACEMGALYADADADGVAAIGLYGESLGMAFQIVDDVLDCADAAETGKPTGGDLREGKLTPPLQLYRDSLDAEKRAAFNEKFAKHAFDEAEIAAICGEIRRLGIDRKVRERADSFLETARQALGRVPQGAERDILLDVLTYVRDRKK